MPVVTNKVRPFDIGNSSCHDSKNGGKYINPECNILSGLVFGGQVNLKG